LGGLGLDGLLAGRLSLRFLRYLYTLCRLARGLGIVAVQVFHSVDVTVIGHVNILMAKVVDHVIVLMAKVVDHVIMLMAKVVEHVSYLMKHHVCVWMTHPLF
jgi:hypothetical protein